MNDVPIGYITAEELEWLRQDKISVVVICAKPEGLHTVPVFAGVPAPIGMILHCPACHTQPCELCKGHTVVQIKSPECEECPRCQGTGFEPIALPIATPIFKEPT